MRVADEGNPTARCYPRESLAEALASECVDDEVGSPFGGKSLHRNGVVQTQTLNAGGNLLLALSARDNPMTFAPASRASWQAIEPTAPAAPKTTTVSPGRSRPTSCSEIWAVVAGTK